MRRRGTGSRGPVAGVALTVLGLLAGALVVVGASGSPASAAGRPLPSYFSLDDSVRQVVTVTSLHWSDTRARLRVWQKRNGRWRLVHRAVRVRLGWNGWVRARDRRQNTGTTPAGSFGMRSVFGNRPDPGSRLLYRRVDGDDVWPYEPRDPATYNIFQPRQAATSSWRTDYRERLADYPYEYAYSIVLGFNMPRGVHWSRTRHQYVARTPADTGRGGGIFLHVQQHRYTAGCVAGPIDDIRWLVRWLRPRQRPRIVMGPWDYVRSSL